MLEDEVEKRVEEVMDLIDDYVGAYRDFEYYSVRYGEHADEYKQAVETKVRILVMAAMVAEMEGAIR